MAEGFAKALRSDTVDAYSAGVAPHGIDPRAVRVMREAGVDISGGDSTHVNDLLARGIDFDVVVTVCDHAHETCPVFPGRTRVVHRGFDDPPRLARDAATEDEAIGHYRRVRDEIRAFVETLPDSILGSG